VDKAWIHYTRRWKSTFCAEVNGFIEAAKKHSLIEKSTKIYCPCVGCKNELVLIKTCRYCPCVGCKNKRVHMKNMQILSLHWLQEQASTYEKHADTVKFKSHFIKRNQDE
jgi:hypothetical protein